MELRPKLVLWRPQILVTGQSFYGVDSATGKITSQRDTWDAVKDSSYLSVEALNFVVRSLTNLQVWQLESPFSGLH